jgi:ribosomal RNA assembly protein
MKYLRVPKERVGVLIGRDGETKKMIEQIAQVSLEIDSDEGEVVIDEHAAQDPLLVLKAEDVVKAIGRGFSPEHAFRLFGEEMELFIFDIYDYAGKKVTHLTRLKSRVIGQEGKTKHVIEGLTGGTIAVYGHTIGVIADFESMDYAKKAIDMLLSGSEHPTVYRYLEREMKKLRMGRRI